MSHRICPSWLGYLLLCPARRWFENPQQAVVPYVREGMRVLEPGPGMGFFTLEVARRVGPSGRVVCVDVQPKMLDRLKKRAAKAGLLDRIDVRLAPADSMGIGDLAGSIDFVLAFAVVHEFPSAENFYREAASTLKPGATMLVAEPAGHVSEVEFEAQLDAAKKWRLDIISHPRIRRFNTALLQKS